MNILVLDNYDSFTYNLVHILRDLKLSHEVFRNDKITPDEVLKYDGIILSPGPGIPRDAGHMPEIIRRYADKIPMLGICLGHQAIAEYLGARLVNMKQVYHGVKTPVFHNNQSVIFQDVPQQFEAGRYHSWTVDTLELPPEMNITARDAHGDIMAFSCGTMYGLQFHPESVMTAEGRTMVENFIKSIG
ncbi:MAG: aminodeoxychorismate/anthranilate synthase component II [Bacteroidia bacterium]